MRLLIGLFIIPGNKFETPVSFNRFWKTGFIYWLLNTCFGDNSGSAELSDAAHDGIAMDTLTSLYIICTGQES